MQSSPRTLLLGGSGMLGHKILQRLRARCPEAMCTIQGQVDQEPLARIPMYHDGNTIENVDVTDSAALNALLRRLRPDVVVNCVGIIKQRDAAHAYIPSIIVNSLLPHQLAETCVAWGGRLIHFSTDCVFSGRRGMYREADVSDAEDLYGKTKFLGETLETNALTLRTSIIGRELMNHRSLLDWFLSNQGGAVRGYRKSIYSGVTTNHLAEVVVNVIDRFPGLSGVYQVASQPISKYDLLHLIRDAYSLDLRIEAVDGEDVNRSMDGSRFGTAVGYSPPSWRDLVAELAGDPTPYGEWLGADIWNVGAPASKKVTSARDRVRLQPMEAEGS